jgi:DNA-binding transcriptional MerR regulator
VRTIRFYSDRGLLPPTSRSPAGYRRYDLDALARLDLVRTLRALGVDLAAIQQVLDREISVPEVAAAHAEALEVQIRTLRLRRAVLRAVAKRGSSPQEMELMHKLAKLSDAERRRIIHQFIDEVFGDLDANPDLVAMLRSAMPELSDDPTPTQVDAWVELAELVQDPDFKASVRRAADHQAADRADGDQSGLHHELSSQIRARVEAARADGIDPASEQARLILADLVGRYVQPSARPTPPTTAARCCSACRPPTTHGLSGTGTCWPPSTAGPLHRPWRRFSSGSSRRSSTTRPDDNPSVSTSGPAHPRAGPAQAALPLRQRSDNRAGPRGALPHQHPIRTSRHLAETLGGWVV